MLAITLDHDIEERLEALGARSETSKIELVRRALLEALEDMEDLRLAERRLARPEKEYSMEDVVRDLGLDD